MPAAELAILSDRPDAELCRGRAGCGSSCWQPGGRTAAAALARRLDLESAAFPAHPAALGLADRRLGHRARFRARAGGRCRGLRQRCGTAHPEVADPKHPPRARRRGNLRARAPGWTRSRRTPWRLAGAAACPATCAAGPRSPARTCPSAPLPALPPPRCVHSRAMADRGLHRARLRGGRAGLGRAHRDCRSGRPGAGGAPGGWACPTARSPVSPPPPPPATTAFAAPCAGPRRICGWVRCPTPRAPWAAAPPPGRWPPITPGGRPKSPSPRATSAARGGAGPGADAKPDADGPASCAAHARRSWPVMPAAPRPI